MKKNLLIVITIMAFYSGMTQTKSDSLVKELENTKQELNHIVSSVDTIRKKLKSTIDSINEKFDKIEGKIVRFGVSIGYNTIYKDQMHNYQSASIDLRDTTLKLETMDPYSIKVSTSIIITPFTNADWLKKARANNRAKLDYLRARKEMLFTQKIDKLTNAGTISKSQKKEIRKSSPRVPRKNLFCANVANIFMYTVQNIGLTANINILEFNKAQSNLAFNKSMEGGVGICLRLHNNIFVSYSNELYFSRQLRENIKNYENQKLYVDGKIVTTISDLNVNDDNIYITRNIIANSFKVVVIF